MRIFHIIENYSFENCYCYTTSFSPTSLYRSINSMNNSVYYLIHLSYSNVYNNTYLQFNILYLPINTIIVNCHGLIITLIYNWEIHLLPALTINSYQIIKYYYNNYNLSKRKNKPEQRSILVIVLSLIFSKGYDFLFST